MAFDRDDPVRFRDPFPAEWFSVREECQRAVEEHRYIDTFGILASAAAELKCAADVIYATRTIPEAMLDTALARLDAAAAAVRAIKERTT